MAFSKARFLWEAKFWGEEAKIVWPFLVAYGIWGYTIHNVDAGLTRSDFEGSKNWNQSKWREIKRAKYDLETVLARKTGVMQELDMEAYCRWADQYFNYLYWNDPRPTWSSLKYNDGSQVRLRWSQEANLSKPTFDQTRRWRSLLPDQTAQKMVWDLQDQTYKKMIEEQKERIRMQVSHRLLEE